MDEHLNVEEIEAAARVGDYETDVQVQDRWVPTTMIGVDRIDFPKVAFWRNDFAPASLGALMNSLAITSDGVLMERSFMRQSGFRVGDTVQVRVRASDNRNGVPMRIVVDLPAPLGPTSAQTAPRSMVNDRASTARKLP